MSDSENKNTRPDETSKMPNIALAVLVCMIAGLLYVGYAYIADDAAEIGELSGTPLDTAGRDMQTILPDNSLPKPESIDTSELGGNKAVALPQEPTEEASDVATDTKPVRPKEEKKPKVEEKQDPVSEPVADVNVGGEDMTHTIEAGETFYGLANRYNMKSSTLKALNPNIKDESKDIKSGVTRIKVKIQAVHTVGPGDILRVVAKKYGITVEQLMVANRKKKNSAERGEKLIIPFAEKQ
jgi:LysM repeat protein